VTCSPPCAPARPSRSSFDLSEFVDLDAQDSAPVVSEALEVADGLRVDERAEVVPETRDRHVGRRSARCDLHGHHRVRPALVELTRRVQEARTVPNGGGGTTEPVAHRAAQALERLVLTEG